MDKQTPAQAACHVIDTWKELTGLPRSAMYNEGDFPQEVYDYLTEVEVDVGEFTDAFVEILG